MLLLQRAPSSMRSAVLPILALLCVLGASAASSSGIAPPRADRSSRRMGPLGRNRHVTASDPPGHGASPQPSRELRGGAAKMAAPAAAASGSAVLNGSFEGDLVRSEWIATPPSASTADLPGSTSGGYEISTTERRTGGQSLRVTDGGAWQTVPLSGAGPGATVTFGGHSRAVGTGQGLFRDYSIYADVRYEDGTELLGEAAVFRGGTTVGWARESAAFVVPRGKTVASLNLHLVYRNDPTGGGVVYFDDVFVEVTGAPPGLAGGGFEAGGDLAADGWRGYMGGYVPSAEEAHSGGRSIAVTSGGAVQTIRPEAGTASAGSVLKMSGWAKSVGASDVAGGPAVMAVYVDVRFTDGTWLRAQEAEFRGGETEGWEYSENRIRLAKDAEEILLRAVYYGDEAARVDGAVAYFDDLAVEIV